MFSLFQQKNLITESQQAWIEMCFGLFVQRFGLRSPTERQLILPTPEYFPLQADSPLALAQACLTQVTQYMGVDVQPFQVRPPENYQPLSPTPLIGPIEIGSNQVALSQVYYIDFHPGQLKNPNALVAVMCVQVTNAILASHGFEIEGGEDVRPAAIEVLAGFLGFGVMMSNSAFTFRGGGCSSCHNSKVGRQSALSEEETCYILALYCHYQNVDVKLASPHLERHLRPLLKRAAKQVAAYPRTQSLGITA
ncbi:hypothetical protein [Motilimonas pumila]|uniref:Uncharacterized protein n=1 Tax=Motilimonas pumila TaxID=2303987 RepID=A0A418YFZ9_9GAMM|nr:hypothetical protein [Motilimonas pumila]RJG48184.1 hypothetical protein D1Z90_08950 [Motilimonas pumila]